MKKINLIEWLSRNSHEKQSPQRFARYAAMLLLLLTCVTHAWAEYYVIGELTAWAHTESEKMTRVGSSNTYYKVVSSMSAGKYRFRVDEGNWEKTHGWSEAITGSSDFTLTNAEDGDNSMHITLSSATSYLTIWFNSSGNKIWVTSGGYATQTMYVIGSNSWTDSKVKAHVWDSDAPHFDWDSDEQMTKESTISRANITYKVYSYTVPKIYKSAIFRYGDGQTGNLDWNASTPYYSTELSAWFASTADALAKYLVGTNWTSASWNHNDEANRMTDNGDGSYSKDVSITDAAKVISLKVSKKGTWDYAYGGEAAGTGHNLSTYFGTDDSGNLTFQVAHAGTTKIKLTSAGKINVDAPYQVSYAAGTGASGTVSASSVTTYGSTCSLSSSTFTKTYYTQDGWATSDGGDKAYNLGATYTGGYEDVTLYPHWTKTTYSITLDDDGDYDGNGSATVQYGDAALTVSSHASRAGWNLVGYFAGGTGDQVTDASGNLLPSKRFQSGGNYYDITNSSSEWIYDGNLKLYAHWTQSPQVTLEANKTTINIGETVRLTATGSNATGITKYDYYVGGVKRHTINSSSTSVYWDYTPSTVSNKSVYVVMTHSGGTETSSTVGITINTPSVSALSAAGSATELWIGVNASGALRFTATSSNVNSAASYTWSISDASSGTFSSVSSAYNTAVWDYTPTSTGAKTITVTLTVGGQNYTRTYNLTVYERWNIYVQKNCGDWTAIALYQYGHGTNASWPGVTGASTYCEPYTAKWYKVTLDSYYPYFILDNNVSGEGKEQLPGSKSVETDKSTYAANTYWDFNYTGTTDGVKYYTLRSISPSVPTVSITSYEVISSTQIKLTGTISNYGSDGSTAASDLKEVGFYCGETKHSTTHTSGSTFTKVITGLSKGTAYNFKAYAVNVKGEGLSAQQSISTRASGTYTIKVRTAVGATAPKIYAWTPADANDGVLEKNATYGSGAAMTPAITGTVYKWWSYDVDKTYNYYIIYETGDGNKTDDISAPQTATCYWYNSSNAQASRYGVMDCPHATPQLYIERTAESGEYDYYEMTNTSGTLSKSLTLTAKSTYKFKIFYNGEYFGKNATATRASNTIDDLSASTDDYAKITTDAAGSYSFSFTTAGKDFTAGYPVAYTITYGIGAINGSDAAISASSSPSFTSGDYVLKTTEVTFSKGSTKNGYHWEGWYSNNDGTGTCHSSTDDNWTSAASTRSADIKVYACYSLNNYTITYHLDGGSNHGSNPSGFTVVTPTITLQDPSKTGYDFDGWYVDEDFKTEGNTIPLGTYANKEFWAKWTAKNYTITLNQNGATTESDPTSLTATYDGKADGDDVFDLTLPEKTGYTFNGWYESAGGTGAEIITTSNYYKWEDNPYVTTAGLWHHDGSVTVYAKWTANNYTVTLSCSGETGYGSSPSGVKESVSATYDAAMPAMGTAPTPLPGWKFMGYFTGHNGSGTKYYNADGSSATNWNIASATTLYAHFQKTVISSLEHPAAVAKGDVVTVDVNPVYNQSDAQDYMAICWSLLYDNDNVVESGVAVAPNPADGKPNQVRFTLTGLSAGYYKVKAVLKASASSSFSPCSAGSELSTIKSDLRIAGNSTVTIQYEDASGNTISAATSVDVARGDSIGVNAPSIVGYTFSEWVLGDVLSSACRDAATCALNKDSINIKAEYDGVLIAKYARKNTIYFKNTLNWPAVYVNLLNEGCWDDDKGSGNKDRANRNLAMTRLGESDIWYYEYGETSTSDYVSFTSRPQANATNFWGEDTEVEDEKVKVVYPTRPNYDANERRAYGFHVNTPMFVPLAGQTAKEMNKYSSGRAYYYNQGYWAKYEPISKETGYKLVIFNKKNSAATPDAGQAPVEVKSVPFTFDGDMTLPVSVTVDLEAGKWYGFKIYRDKGNTGDALSWYSNNNNMSNQHSGDFSKGETVWEFKTTRTANCGLKTNSAGDYVVTLDYGKEASKDSMQYLVGVHYPEATGDYRLVYSDANRTCILSTTIPFNSEADTLSFFVDNTASPRLALQHCTVSRDGETSTVAWTDTIANLFSGGLPAAITKKGVYYFCINKDPETGKKVFGDTKLYEGNFYIRTDGATPSKWDNFRQNNHLMAYSDYADEYENFTHSYTQWYDLTNRKNLKFTVANDYSVSISDTLIREDLSGIDQYIDAKGDLNRTANVRFMYNQKTNAISRAYIDGAYEADGNFLKIWARTQDSIYAAAEGGDPLTEITFTDNGNWLYEQTVFAQPGARYKLRSIFGTTEGGKHEITQYFKGGAGSTAADSATMIGGDGSSRMQIRLLYDFKTNRVVTAYQPAGTINDDLEIHADIMFMREHQGDINEITFASGKKIKDIENIYCGLRFNKWTLNNKSKEEGHATLSPLLSRYERDIFYVSFPYDVKLSDAIGFGTYGTHWIVEYYDGAERAKNGFWIDSDSYWKFVTPAMKDTFTLKAGTGYIVALDLDELYYIDESHHASIWNNTDISDLEILFPGKVSSISNIDVTYNMPSHECKINRGTTAGNRTKKDSHWNVLGVPTFKNITGAASADGGGSGEIRFANTAWIKDSLNNELKFIYDGNLADNSLTPKAVKDFEFKAMHAYVVQYCGNVTFTTSATPAPTSVAARTYAETPQEVDFRLELNKDGVVEDQTFVSLSNDENASADFQFGEDMSKEFNSNRANIYTFIGTEWVAGNTLPMSEQTTVVPVGVKIVANGDYTFSIPEGTNGVGVTLIDNETGIRTSLSALDYTINLPAGTYDNRFVLEISPIVQSPTGIESTEHRIQNTDVRKVLIDNILYIVKDGVMYDAQGKRLQ